MSVGSTSRPATTWATYSSTPHPVSSTGRSPCSRPPAMWPLRFRRRTSAWRARRGGGRSPAGGTRAGRRCPRRRASRRPGRGGRASCDRPRRCSGARCARGPTVVRKSVEQATGRPALGDGRELARREARDVGPVVRGGDQLVLGQGRERRPLDGLELRGHAGRAVDDRDARGLADPVTAPRASARRSRGRRHANRTPTPASSPAPVARAASMPKASVTRPSTIGPMT